MILAINKVALEPYKSKNKIEANTSSGFATIKQKQTLVGLKVMVDSKIKLGDEVVDLKKGQIVYFSEEILHAYDWSKKVYEIEGSSDKFILAEPNHIAMIGGL